MEGHLDAEALFYAEALFSKGRRARAGFELI
jgi:hypothetical protein